MGTIFPWNNPIENKSKYISWKTYTDLGTKCLWHLSMATWCTKQMHTCLFGLVPCVTSGFDLGREGVKATTPKWFVSSAARGTPPSDTKSRATSGSFSRIRPLVILSGNWNLPYNLPAGVWGFLHSLRSLALNSINPPPPFTHIHTPHTHTPLNGINEVCIRPVRQTDSLIVIWYEVAPSNIKYLLLHDFSTIVTTRLIS